MAIVGTKLEVMREGNAEVAVKTERVLDTKTGLVLERKTVVAAVPTQDGKTAIIAGQRTSLAAIQPRPGSSQLRAIEEAPSRSYGSGSYGQSSGSDDSCDAHVFFCVASLFFPPCLLCWMLYCCAKCCDD